MWSSSSLWNRKRTRDEGFQAMSFPPHKRTTPLLTQQRWSQASKPHGFLNSHLDQKPIEEQSPLGLQLKKSQSFLELIQKKLSEESKSEAKKDLTSRKKQDDKHKASNFAVSHIKIGNWEYKTLNAGTGIMAKFYYSKHKLVWEVLHSGLKYKMEIQWSDITALKGNFPENEPGTLALVLGKPPIFFKENDPQPKKHTLWHASKDFTGGQASTYRQHFLEFPPGVLDKHYKKLIQCDSRLGLLSQLQDPVLSTPYFLTVASKPAQSKDGEPDAQSEKLGGPSVHNLHDLALSPPLLLPSNIEQQGTVPLHSPSNFGLTDDSSCYSHSPLSDTLTSFDYGSTRLEPVTESPIPTLNDLVLSSTTSSVRQQHGSFCNTHEELSKDVFGRSPNSGVPNVASLSDFNLTNVEQQIPLGVSHQDFSDFEFALDDLPNVERGVSLGLPNQDFSDYGVTLEDLSNFQQRDSLGIPNQELSNFEVTPEDLLNVEQQVSLGLPNQDLSDFEASLKNFSNLEQRVSLGISHQNMSNSAQPPIPVIGTCGTRVNSNSEAQIFDTLEGLSGPSLRPSTSIDDLMGRIDFEELHQVLFSDTTTAPADNSLMSKVNSFSNVLNCNHNSENNPMNRLVNSEGIHDGRVLGPVISHGFTPENKVQNDINLQWHQNSENNPMAMNILVNPEGVQGGGRVLEPVFSYGFTPETKLQSDNALQWDPNSGNNLINRVNSEGVQDGGRVLEPVISYGFTPQTRVQSDNVLQWNQTSENNPMNIMANSEEGVQDGGRVLEPVISYGFTPGEKVQGDDVVAQEKNLNDPTQLQTMSRVDSWFDLLHDLPRIQVHRSDYNNVIGALPYLKVNREN